MIGEDGLGEPVELAAGRVALDRRIAADIVLTSRGGDTARPSGFPGDHAVTGLGADDSFP